MPEESNEKVKLTVDEHRLIAMHLHAADHHLMKAMRTMFTGYRPFKDVPIEIAEALEEVVERIGASASFSHHCQGSIADQCHKVLDRDHPGDTLEIYFGSYADCARTLAMDSPDKASKVQPKTLEIVKPPKPAR